jgi:hypothetical protein
MGMEAHTKAPSAAVRPWGPRITVVQTETTDELASGLYVAQAHPEIHIGVIKDVGDMEPFDRVFGKQAELRRGMKVWYTAALRIDDVWVVSLEHVLAYSDE